MNFKVSLSIISGYLVKNRYIYVITLLFTLLVYFILRHEYFTFSSNYSGVAVVRMPYIESTQTPLDSPINLMEVLKFPSFYTDDTIKNCSSSSKVISSPSLIFTFNNKKNTNYLYLNASSDSSDGIEKCFNSLIIDIQFFYSNRIETLKSMKLKQRTIKLIALRNLPLNSEALYNRVLLNAEIDLIDDYVNSIVNAQWLLPFMITKNPSSSLFDKFIIAPILIGSLLAMLLIWLKKRYF